MTVPGPSNRRIARTAVPSTEYFRNWSFWSFRFEQKNKTESQKYRNSGFVGLNGLNRFDWMGKTIFLLQFEGYNSFLHNRMVLIKSVFVLYVQCCASNQFRNGLATTQIWPRRALEQWRLQVKWNWMKIKVYVKQLEIIWNEIQTKLN